MIRNSARRRAACLAARAAAMGSAVMLTLTVWGLSFSGLPNADAATNAGALTVVVPVGEANAGDPLTSGGSSTPFSLLPPAGAACTGDSASDSYTVVSFMVPSSVDPATLTFSSLGPIPIAVGASFRQPLYDSLSSSSYMNEATLDNPGSPRPRPGEVINVPGFNLAVFEPGNIPAGTYTLGLACVTGAASPTQLDKYWTVQFTVVEDGADAPAGVTWTVVEGSGTTTTTAAGGSTTTTTTAGGGTTTTTAGGGSTTTVEDTTTTTSGDGGDTTGGDDGFDTGGAPSGTPIVQGLTTLPATGTSALPPILWAALLLIFGRMAILLGRPPRVLPPRS